MLESTHTYQVIIPYSIEEVWQALKHAADLDVAGGQEIVERVSDAEWTTALDERHSTRCTAAYDEAARRMDATMDSTAKHENDTTSISLASVDAGTEVTVEQTVRGNFVVMKMLQLVGVGALDKVAGSIVSNIDGAALRRRDAPDEHRGLGGLRERTRGRLGEGLASRSHAGRLRKGGAPIDWRAPFVALCGKRATASRSSSCSCRRSAPR